MIYMVPVDGPPRSPRLNDNFLVDDEIHNSSLVYQATAVYQARYQWTIMCISIIYIQIQE